jgi:hypothetical protein
MQVRWQTKIFDKIKFRNLIVVEKLSPAVTSLFGPLVLKIPQVIKFV